VNAHAAPAVVLVADDEPTMLELVSRHLRSIEKPRLEVIEASDGDEAWKLARERLPDLVVLDVMMPGMSGLEVAARLREARPRPGVMLLSAKAQSSDVAAGLALADDYVTKPFDSMDLAGRVAALIGALGAAWRDA
jgi:two-component system, OmpR family, response regulator